jgi:hypothetical protein
MSVLNKISNALSPPQLAAFRNVASGVGGIVLTLGIIHISPDQFQVLLNATVNLGTAIGAFCVALGPVMIGLSSAYAAWSATKQHQVNTVAAMPGTTLVVPPAIAAASPSLNVVSSADMKVVSK